MKKLNMQGFAHSVALAIVIVLTGVVGTYYLVASNADSCSALPASVLSASSVSGQKCDSVSAPVSSPTAPPPSTPAPPKPATPAPSSTIVRATCIVSNIPATAKKNTIISPTVTITNTGNQVFSADFTSTVLPQDKSGKRIDGKIGVKNMNVNLKPGQSVRQNLQSYKVPIAYGNTARIFYNVYNASPSIQCNSTSFKLPV